jgi:hypothetical protein
VKKRILHFGEDQDQKNLYILILKAVDIPTDQLETFRDHLQSKGIEIFAIARKSIEAKFSDKYRSLVVEQNKLTEMDTLLKVDLALIEIEIFRKSLIDFFILLNC